MKLFSLIILVFFANSSHAAIGRDWSECIRKEVKNVLGQTEFKGVSPTPGSLSWRLFSGGALYQFKASQGDTQFSGEMIAGGVRVLNFNHSTNKNESAYYCWMVSPESVIVGRSSILLKNEVSDIVFQIKGKQEEILRVPSSSLF